MRVLFCVLLLSSGVNVLAHQPVDGDIYASFGGMTYLTTPFKHPFNPNPVLLAPGLAVEADVGSRGGVEISMFYLDNPFSVKETGKLVVEQIKRVYISTGYRLWFNPRISAAAAFASSYIIGDKKTLRDDFNGANTPPTSASDVTEYGVDLSLQDELFRRARYSLIVDGRYGWSLTPKSHEDSDHVGVFLALKYFLQARTRNPEVVASPGNLGPN